MILDEAKISSDDSFFNESHILFLLTKHRADVLRTYYISQKAVNRSFQFNTVHEDNYQMICIGLESVSMFEGIVCAGGIYLRSVNKIPATLGIGMENLSTIDQFQGFMSLVSNTRFRYANNRYAKNWIYGTIGKDGYLYLKSCNPQMSYLQSVKLTAVFSNPERASELECDKSETQCDILDSRFPIEESLIPYVIKSVVDEILPKTLLKEDLENNAQDDTQRNRTQDGRQ